MTDSTLQLQAEKTELVQLFPTFVWKTDLAREAYEPINARIRDKLAEILGGEIRLEPEHSFQTDQDLYRYPEFRELVAFIQSALGGVIDYLGIAAENAALTGCWANVNAPGARHRPHTHPNNLLSGVYYVQTAPGADRITFDDPRAQTYIIYPRASEGTLHNGVEINLTVSEGTLLVFPAWLQHRVGENRSDIERISVSFNAMTPLGAPAGQPGPITRHRD